MVYPTLLPLMRTPRLPVLDWTDTPADLNGLVRFAERLNLFSARVPSHFERSILISWWLGYLIPALVSLKARFVYRNLCICPPCIPQRKQSHIISYWSPCKVSVIFNESGIWRQILAEIADMKFHKNPCYGRRGNTDEVMGLVLANLYANAPQIVSINEVWRRHPFRPRGKWQIPANMVMSLR